YIKDLIKHHIETCALSFMLLGMVFKICLTPVYDYNSKVSLCIFGLRMKHLRKIMLSIIFLAVITVFSLIMLETTQNEPPKPAYKSSRHYGDIHPHFVAISDSRVTIEQHLDEHRSKGILEARFSMPQSGKFKDVTSSRDDYFIHIATEYNIKTLLFQIMDSDKDGHDVFQWIGSKSLCTALANYKGNIRYSNSCTTNIEKTFSAQRPEPKLRFKLPLNYKLTKEVFQLGTVSSFIHLIQNGIISNDGVVFVGDLQVIPYSCLARPEAIQASKKHFITTIKDKLDKLPRYREVFVITQFWSAAFYHGMVESLPRLSRYIGFIDQRTEIKIYVACTAFMNSSLQ
ncbi:unnamed protein product, partial [Owenia fusiformis]